jgi:hypothetical protein
MFELNDSFNVVDIKFKKMKKKLYEKIYKNIPDSSKITILNNTEKNACYIFGDGKSLKYYDLTSFSDLPSISLGLVSLHIGSKFLNLKYSMICDPFILWPGKNLYYYVKRKVKETIKSKEYFRALSYISPYKLLEVSLNSISKLLFTDNKVLLNSNIISHCSNYKYVKFLSNSFYYHQHLKINENIDNDPNNIFNNKHYIGSLHFAIYFAYFLGFNKIYLIGCDYLDFQPTATHWYEKGKPVPHSGETAEKYIEYMRNFIEIKIITLNKSYGEHFISYKDFSGNNLEYKENNEILSKKKLAMLKIQGLYTI